MTATPIPWVFTDESGILQWTWLTDHLVARISGTSAMVDGQRHVASYGWELCDRMTAVDGLPRLLIEGRAGTFDEAERAVREHVGKAYDPRLGYRAYAGGEATTFTLGTGERRDLASYLGSRCSLTVRESGAATVMVVGDLSVRHYSLVVRDGAVARDVIPEHVVHIDHVGPGGPGGGMSLSSVESGGRLLRQEWSPGCTGRPGFDVGTVDHGGAAPCPIHERQAPWVTSQPIPAS